MSRSQLMNAVIGGIKVSRDQPYPPNTRRDYDDDLESDSFAASRSRSMGDPFETDASVVGEPQRSVTTGTGRKDRSSRSQTRSQSRSSGSASYKPFRSSRLAVDAQRQLVSRRSSDEMSHITVLIDDENPGAPKKVRLPLSARSIEKLKSPASRSGSRVSSSKSPSRASQSGSREIMGHTTFIQTPSGERVPVQPEVAAGYELAAQLLEDLKDKVNMHGFHVCEWYFPLMMMYAMFRSWFCLHLQWICSREGRHMI
jgi:hypothetical protein